MFLKIKYVYNCFYPQTKNKNKNKIKNGSVIFFSFKLIRRNKVRARKISLELHKNKYSHKTVVTQRKGLHVRMA